MDAAPAKTKLSPAQIWNELAAAGLLLMELTWLVFWFAVLYNDSVAPGGVPVYGRDTFALAGGVLGVMYVGAYLTARAFSAYDVKIEIRRAVFAVLLLLSLWFGLLLLVRPVDGITGPATPIARLLAHFGRWPGLPPEFWVLLAVGLVWWRAVRLARYPVSLEQVLVAFQFIMFTLLFTELFRYEITDSVRLNPIFVIAFLGLFAMGAARIADLAGMRGSRVARFNRTWLAGLAGSSLVVVLFAALFIALLNGWLGEQIGQLFLIILTVIGGIIMLALLPLTGLMGRLLIWLQGLIASWASDMGFNLGAMGEQLQKWAGQQSEQNAQMLDQVLRAGKTGAMIALLAGVLLAVLIGLRMRRRSGRGAGAEENQSLMNPGDLLRELAEAARKAAQDALENLAKRLNPRQAMGLIRAARIRWIYAQLMILSAEMGKPRPAAATPLEFQSTLGEVFPAAGEALNTITQAYLRVRYGELPETGSDVDAVVHAWERVKTEGRAQKRNRA